MAGRPSSITDESFQEEVERLKASPYVKLARKEQRLKYRQRQILYQLRNLEKRGRELDRSGVTLENMEDMLAQVEMDAEALEDKQE